VREDEAAGTKDAVYDFHIVRFGAGFGDCIGETGGGLSGGLEEHYVGCKLREVLPVGAGEDHGVRGHEE